MEAFAQLCADDDDENSARARVCKLCYFVLLFLLTMLFLDP